MKTLPNFNDLCGVGQMRSFRVVARVCSLAFWFPGGRDTDVLFAGPSHVYSRTAQCAVFDTVAPQCQPFKLVDLFAVYD